MLFGVHFVFFHGNGTPKSSTIQFWARTLAFESNIVQCCADGLGEAPRVEWLQTCPHFSVLRGLGWRDLNSWRARYQVSNLACKGYKRSCDGRGGGGLAVKTADNMLD